MTPSPINKSKEGSMKNMKQQLSETIDFIRSSIKDTPYIGVLTGTGLGESAESMTIETTVTYQDIPHFPISTVQSHIGRMLCGNMNGWPAYCHARPI